LVRVLGWSLGPSPVVDAARRRVECDATPAEPAEPVAD